MKDNEHKFYALTPINDVDIGVYERALNFVFDNDNILNVAISGSYGSGKSSVLASYKRRQEDKNDSNIHDKKYIHISLAHFAPEETDESLENEDKEEHGIEAMLEGKILNQLIHQISPERIALTNFRVKKETSKKKNVITTVLAATGIMLGLYTFLFTQWASFVQKLSEEWLKSVLWFSTQPESRFWAGIVLVAIFGIFAYRLIKLQESRHIFKRADISGVEIEIFEDCNESYFDKYLNEVLYLFEKADADVIVFEDIDRYDSSRIFERLHEINRLVNNNRKNKENRTDVYGNSKPLRFFYLMRDDIFVSKDRTKFFDFIIPIVPVVDGSNSFGKFIECFEQSDLVGGEKDIINRDFLQGLSLYVDDMRILQNICNEFLIYYKKVVDTEQNPNKMLALIAFKNLFPRDFANLQLGRGFMYEIVGGRGKERLVANEKAMLKEKIESKVKYLEAVKSEDLSTGEIAVLYHTKLFSELKRRGSTIFQPSDDPQTCKSDIEGQRNRLQQYKDLFDDYDSRLNISEESDNVKLSKISVLETEIDDLKLQQTKLSGLRLKDIISRENIKSLFEAVFESETGNNNNDFVQIKDSPYFDLLKYLVWEGYIDETYSDYMTPFYPNSLTRIDKIYLRSVTDKKAKEPAYKLDNPCLVASRLPVAYFEQEEALNYDLFNFLIDDYSFSRKFVDKTKTLIWQIIKNHYFEFLLGYCENNLSEYLVKALGIEWTSFISDFFTKQSISEAPSKPKTKNDIFIKRYAYVLLSMIGEQPERTSYLDEPSKNLLVRYISNDADFLTVDECNDANVALGIKQLDICFEAVDAKSARRSLLESVYKNNSYAINYSNIETMLKIFYKKVNISSLQTANFSVVMAEVDSSLSMYLNNNLDAYMGVILSNCNKAITDTAENVITLLNSVDIAIEKKKTYISYLKTSLHVIVEIKDDALWEELLKNPISIDYTAANIVAYYKQKSTEKFDDALVKYINGKGTTVVFTDCFEGKDNEIRSRFFTAIVKSTGLTNDIYKGYLKQFHLQYSSFAIAGLPNDKIAITDELDIIKMSAESLAFMRENYEGYLYTFIVRHIAEYITIVTEPAVFLRDEMLVLLESEISDTDKISLLELEKAPISIAEQSYSDGVMAHILENNFEASTMRQLKARI